MQIQITLDDLVHIHRALGDAKRHISTQIGLHPAPREFPEDIEDLDAEFDQYDALQKRIEQLRPELAS
jgi:hypothetical protein